MYIFTAARLPFYIESFSYSWTTALTNDTNTIYTCINTVTSCALAWMMLTDSDGGDKSAILGAIAVDTKNLPIGFTTDNSIGRVYMTNSRLVRIYKNNSNLRAININDFPSKGTINGIIIYK